MTGHFDTPQTVRVGGLTMAYRMAGAGPPVVALHGIPTNSLLWRKVQVELDDKFTLIAPDLIGYGHSQKPDDIDLSIVNQASWVKSFVETIAAEPVVLVGHDIGGGIAQLVTAHWPDLVQRLILVSTIAYDSWPEPGIARLKDTGWDAKFESIDLAAGFQRGLAGGLVNRSLATPELAQMYAEPFMADGAQSYLRAARSLRTEDLVEATDAIESIGKPTTLVWGEQDPYQDVTFGERLATRLPNAHLIVLDGVSHFVPEEAPRRLASIIANGT